MINKLDVRANPEASTSNEDLHRPLWDMIEGTTSISSQFRFSRK